MLRTWLKPVVDQYAEDVVFSRRAEAETRSLLAGQAVCMGWKAKFSALRWMRVEAIALEMLDEAINRLEDQYSKPYERMISAAARDLSRGHIHAAKAAASIAREAKVPPYYVGEAVRHAVTIAATVR